MAESRAKLRPNTFSINVRRYSQNHNSIFGSPYCGIRGNKALYVKVLMQRNFVAEFRRDNASFARKTAS